MLCILIYDVFSISPFFSILLFVNTVSEEKVYSFNTVHVVHVVSVVVQYQYYLYQKR